MDPYGILPYLKPHFATKKITIWVIAKKDRKKKGEKKIGNSPFWVIATSKKDRKKNKKNTDFLHRLYRHLMEVQDLCESETKWKPVRIGSTKWWMSPKMVDLSNKNIVFLFKKIGFNRPQLV